MNKRKYNVFEDEDYVPSSLPANIYIPATQEDTEDDEIAAIETNENSHVIPATQPDGTEVNTIFVDITLVQSLFNVCSNALCSKEQENKVLIKQDEFINLLQKLNLAINA